MRTRRIQQISEMPLVIGARDCARLLGITYEAFNQRRRAGDWPPPFNRYGYPQWHRDVVEAYIRGERREVA